MKLIAKENLEKKMYKFFLERKQFFGIVLLSTIFFVATFFFLTPKYNPLTNEIKLKNSSKPRNISLIDRQFSLEPLINNNLSDEEYYTALRPWYDYISSKCNDFLNYIRLLSNCGDLCDYENKDGVDGIFLIISFIHLFIHFYFF